MKLDDSLLTSPNRITIDDLKAYFRKNDFISSVNPSGLISVRPNRERIYPKIRSCFVDAWNRSLKKLGIDLCGKQVSENAPLNILKQTDEKIVTEAVLDIIEDEERIAPTRTLCRKRFHCGRTLSAALSQEKNTLPTRQITPGRQNK